MSYSNIYVTPSTSLILIKSLAKQNIVFLSPYNVPDFQVNVRDITGLSSLQTTPIQISTINGAIFSDQSHSYAIDQPYGFVNMSLRASTIWQILHTSGQTPAQSAANIGTTNISTTFFSLVSTASKQVSSLVLQNLETPNSIQLTGPFIVGNLSTPGFILFQSTLNVYGNVEFDKPVFVSGATSFLSSLAVNSITPISTVIRTYDSIGVGGFVNVGKSVTVASTLQTQSTLQIQTLEVQKSTSEIGIEVTGNTFVSGLVSTLQNLQVGNQLNVHGNVTINETVSSLAGSFITGSLIEQGNMFVLGNTSSFSTATFASSLTIQSTLFIRSFFSTLSTMNVSKNVSAGTFFTTYLSSSTSFSTAGEFSILSSLTVKGNLSTYQATVGKLFSVGGQLVTLSNISTLENAFLNSATVSQSASLGFFTVSTFAGVGGNIDVRQNLTVNSLQQKGNLNVNYFETQQSTIFEQNIGVATDIYVKGNIDVLGIPYIQNFNVNSFAVKNLEITASSPTIALQANDFVTSNVLNSDVARFAYDEFNPTQNFSLFGDVFASDSILTPIYYPSNLRATSLYTSTFTTTDNPLQFEVITQGLFPRGLSTPIVIGEAIQAQSAESKFIGDGSFITNIGITYSTLSASLLIASTIDTQVFSSPSITFSNGYIQSQTIVSTGVSFYTQNSKIGEFLAEDVPQSQPKIPFIEAFSPTVLNINNTLYLDAANRRVGVMTSTPQYDLDINGSLYYTGNLIVSTIQTVNYSTTKNLVTFSTIYYSSIFINDTLVLPDATEYPSNNRLSIWNGKFTSFEKVLVLSKRILPVSPINVNPSVGAYDITNSGIYYNSNVSTLDFNFSLVVNNYNKNVQVNPFSFDPTNGLLSFTTIPSSIDLWVQGLMTGTQFYMSTLTVNRLLQTSTIVMPTLGINPIHPSTFNLISTSFDQDRGNTVITVNNSLELYKNPSLKGSVHMGRPASAPFETHLLNVYNNAYFSSLIVENLFAKNIVFESQVL